MEDHTDEKIQRSAEDYFETIYILKNRNGSVRAIDIVNEMGFSKPTVSVAMKKIPRKRLYHSGSGRSDQPDPAGTFYRRKNFEKHNVIARALLMLGVSEETAYEDACRIEHCISDESFTAIKDFLKKQAQSKTNDRTAVIKYECGHFFYF